MRHILGLRFFAMLVSDFHFDLPDELIARFPAKERTSSRLLHLNGINGELHHRQFKDLLTLLKPEDILVFNNTRVIPARLFGRKDTGGKVEILVERVLNQYEVLAHVRSSKSPKPGAHIVLENDTQVLMVEREGELFRLKFLAAEGVLPQLAEVGHMPLPPYIDREDESSDRSRYQTVYAERDGAVAAPTAGLHFDEAMLNDIRAKGCETVFVTLHVGAGTFQSIRVDRVEDHKMHSEYVEVDASVVQKINAAKARGGRVIAVGTTSLRSLEAASQSGQLEPFQGETDIFIYPGYSFKTVDALVTNFHLPSSTLIMLVSAFAGTDNVRRAYHEAVEQRYRFFSYGDAMFIEKNLLASDSGV